ncbi:MAG: alpha/beta hydrolase [Rubritepida sp.]|nr:alpha/beta hydrolase [Rubritepida sp.]
MARRGPARWCLAIPVAALALGCARAEPAPSLPRADGGRTALRVHGPAAGCPDTVIFSHGLGGSEAGAAGLAEALAAKGWRVMVMGHAESGRGVLREALQGADPRQRLVAAATDPARHRARLADLDATLHEATRHCRPRRLVLAGHSMGAATTMLEAGATGRAGAAGADRFDAYVAISPQGVGVYWEEGAWRAVRKPVLMVTGTRDAGLDGDHTTRLAAFDGLPPGPHRLAVIEGAGHLALAGDGAAMGAILARLMADFLAGEPSAIAGVRVRAR